MTTESLAPEGVITDEMVDVAITAYDDAPDTDLGDEAMRAALAAVYPLIRAAVLEEAAKEIEKLPWLVQIGEKHVRGRSPTDCAATIRALTAPAPETSPRKHPASNAARASDNLPSTPPKDQ